MPTVISTFGRILVDPESVPENAGRDAALYVGKIADNTARRMNMDSTPVDSKTGEPVTLGYVDDKAKGMIESVMVIAVKSRFKPLQRRAEQQYEEDTFMSSRPIHRRMVLEDE